MLEVLHEQRKAHIRKLQEKGDSRVSAAQPDIELSDDGMKDIMKNWRNTPTLWMKGDNLEMLNNLWAVKGMIM